MFMVYSGYDVMTKSIEERAAECVGKVAQDEYMSESEIFSAKDFFLAGAKARDKQWQAVVNELRRLVISQPRYTDNNQQEVVERDSFIRAMNELESIDKKLKEMGIESGK